MGKKRGKRQSTNTFTFNIPPGYLIAVFLPVLAIELISMFSTLIIETLLFLLVIAVVWGIFRVMRLFRFEKRIRIGHVSLEDIDEMTGIEFETFLSELYQTLGYGGEMTPHTDFGIDLIVIKDGIRTGIQAKCYGEGRTVGVAAVNEVCGGAGHWKVQKKVVITNRCFTKKAKISARSNRVKLIDRNDLQEMINDYNKMVNSKEYIPPPSA